MTPETVVQIMRQALMLTFWLAAPLLAIGFIAGIVISLVQIATSIQDNAVSSIPRLVGVPGRAAAAAAVDAAEDHGVHHRAVRETWAAMPANLTLSTGTLFGFLLVLARVGGALVFVPLPGIRRRARTGAGRAGAGLHAGAVVALAGGRRRLA